MESRNKEVSIAAGHKVTANAAKLILEAGGNAVDAAIAAFLCSWVAEPCMSSGGGGAFALVMMQEKEIKLFDFFCQTPKNKRPVSEVDFFPIVVDFGETKEIFHIGRGSIAVPGAIAGVFSLHEHYGTIPIKELVQPAIQVAREGVIVNDFQYLDFELLEPILRQDEKSQSLFFQEDQLIKVGEKMCMPELADYLDYMAREGQDSFYKGEIAQKIVAEQKALGGYLILEDFENYEVIVRSPLSFGYRNKKIYTNPFPSIGGNMIQLFLQQLEQQMEYSDWQTDTYLERLFPVLQNLDLQKKTNMKSGKWGSTTHFNIVDSWGNAVSLSSTNGEGCGHFIENTNIQLNNMLGESALLPNGFHSWGLNTRLSSMMSPTMIVNQNATLETVLGTGGASRIPSAISQVIHLMIDHGLPATEAVNIPRAHFEHGQLNIEPGLKIGKLKALSKEQLISWEQHSLFFGGVHVLQKNRENWLGVGDSRRDGVVV